MAISNIYKRLKKKEKISILGSCSKGNLLKINMINDAWELIYLSNIKYTQRKKNTVSGKEKKKIQPEDFWAELSRFVVDIRFFFLFF